MSLEIPKLEARVRRSYEIGRIRVGLGHALLLLPLVALAVWVGTYRWAVCAFGVASIATVALATWRGREGARAFVPGVLLGLIPFTAAHGARALPHACAHGSCTTWCVTACTLGGFLAGSAIVMWAHRFLSKSNKSAFILYAAAITGAIGAMGCTCVGSAGVVGLALGLGVSVAPALLHALKA